MESEINKKRVQREFWEKESKLDGYCESFLNDVKNNHWLDMLFRVEKNKKIKVSGKVLEIGGGSQYLSRYIAKNRKSFVICTDISNQRIINFNKYYGEELVNLNTVGDINAEKIPFEDNYFDFIIGEAVLHHIEDIRSSLYEINRCLKPGGVAIFLREPNVGVLSYFKRKLKFFCKKFTNKYKNKEKIFIDENRYEYNKNYLQWMDEFYMANLDVDVLSGWYFYPNKISILKSKFPFLFSCFVCFYLKKLDL